MKEEGPTDPEWRHVSGWGRYPSHHALCLQPGTEESLKPGLQGFNGIVRGAGRSYGDSALADQLLSLAALPATLQLDVSTGILQCSPALSLAEVINYCLPRGWTLPVVPGTAAVTIGGAIASDVHGKNHHRDGCFSTALRSFVLLLADGSELHCSATSQADVFHATCGGMGLTGVISQAELQLAPISSPTIHQRSLRSTGLAQTLAMLATHKNSHYSVAWLDCMARDQELGRGIVFSGEHAKRSVPATAPVVPLRPRLTVPFATPGSLLNRYSMRLFNHAYYRLSARKTGNDVDYARFFFPLDSIAHWNLLYGRKGFIQYQFVLPDNSAEAGMTEIVRTIADSGLGAFLCVLKHFGQQNSNLLSFPRSGFTLALDFRLTSALLPLLERLDAMVLAHGGRIYLCKDARMSRDTFRRSYPKWQDFVELRQRLGAHHSFNSLQSQRLGL